MEERGHDNDLSNSYCVKSILIQNCSGPYFHSFGRNTEIYVQTWENTDQNNSKYGHFYAVPIANLNLAKCKITYDLMI